jgi:hypothetical protein
MRQGPVRIQRSSRFTRTIQQAQRLMGCSMCPMMAIPDERGSASQVAELLGSPVVRHGKACTRHTQFQPEDRNMTEHSPSLVRLFPAPSETLREAPKIFQGSNGKKTVHVPSGMVPDLTHTNLTKYGGFIPTILDSSKYPSDLGQASHK